MIQNPTFVFHSELCSGCMACAVACKDKHAAPHQVQSRGGKWRRVLEYSGGEWQARPNGTFEQDVFVYYISVSCNHCEDAPCVAVCPTKAMHKDAHGIVIVDQNTCVGCRVCASACPYGALQYDAELKKMTKCDFCRDALEKGEAPACVAACPCRALDFGTYEDMAAQYGSLPVFAPLPDSKTITPHFFCVPSRHAKA